jgi:hypothetical protein
MKYDEVDRKLCSAFIHDFPNTQSIKKPTLKIRDKCEGRKKNEK